METHRGEYCSGSGTPGSNVLVDFGDREIASFLIVVVERMCKRSGISGMVVVAATGRGSIRARHKVEAPGLQRTQ